MTKSAIDLAREALHRGHVALRNHEISNFAAVERAYSEISQALAALTTEPGLPDRERVAKELDEIVDRATDPERYHGLRRLARWAATGLYRTTPFEHYDVGRKAKNNPLPGQIGLFAAPPPSGEGR